MGTALTPKALGLSRIWLGVSAHEYAYTGHGYRIARVTTPVLAAWSQASSASFPSM